MLIKTATQSTEKYQKGPLRTQSNRELDLLLNLIGLESGASVLGQSQSGVTQNLRNTWITFETQIKIAPFEIFSDVPPRFLSFALRYRIKNSSD